MRDIRPFFRSVLIAIALTIFSSGCLIVLVEVLHQKGPNLPEDPGVAGWILISCFDFIFFLGAAEIYRRRAK
jgi:hypothetical protein